MSAVGKKDGIKVENIREDEEGSIIYEGDSEMGGDECNEWESSREEAMVDKEIELEEEMVLDDGIEILDGYMRG